MQYAHGIPFDLCYIGTKGYFLVLYIPIYVILLLQYITMFSYIKYYVYSNNFLLKKLRKCGYATFFQEEW